MRKLSASERSELLDFLSTRMPGRYKHDLVSLGGTVLRAARFYVPMDRERELEVRRLGRVRREAEIAAEIGLSPAGIVEDAGVDDLHSIPPTVASPRPN